MSISSQQKVQLGEVPPSSAGGDPAAEVPAPSEELKQEAPEQHCLALVKMGSHEHTITKGI